MKVPVAGSSGHIWSASVRHIDRRGVNDCGIADNMQGRRDRVR
jgi:hypothetical protein